MGVEGLRHQALLIFAATRGRLNGGAPSVLCVARQIGPPAGGFRGRPMRLLLNILWFVFGGWISGTLWLLAGLILAVTIVGLPWTPAAFRLASFSYWPFGRMVVDSDRGATSLLLNIVWFVAAGWWLALHHIALALVLASTLIGLPFAWQHLKFAVIALAPVGKTVVEV
jgi:uncharacterized membrane protein YccF (DUF307 family)